MCALVWMNVHTLVGNGKRGVNDGVGSGASLNEPLSVALDSLGFLYVGEHSGLIRRINARGGSSFSVATLLKSNNLAEIK